MATAVLELFPETKLGHGPATESGFFYDFYRPTPFTPDDLKAIEAKMAEVVARDEKFVREWEPREEALEHFRADGDFMKIHFVERFTNEGEDVSLYRNGAFVDFCRGPACALNWPREGLQGDESLRCLLAGQREESAAAAYLRHGVLLEEGPGRLSRAARGGQAAGPSRAGQGAGAVYGERRRRFGSAAVASQGRDHPADSGGVHSGAGARAGISARLHARASQKWTCIFAPGTGRTITRTCFRRWTSRPNRWCCGR